jgi:hypothetical protein
MKKIICICSLLFLAFSSIYALPESEVNAKVIKTFKSGFPDVKAHTWYKFENYYEVYFKETDDRSSKIDYNFDGTLLRSLQYYQGSNLPAFIKAKLNEKYPGKSIFGVVELTSEDEHTYNIILQDEKYWYNLTSDDKGRINLSSKLIKA